MILALMLVLQILFLVEANDFEQNDKIIMDILSSFTSKLENKTLTEMDVKIISLLMTIIKRRLNRLQEEERNKEQPVFWYSRKGRSSATDLSMK